MSDSTHHSFSSFHSLKGLTLSPYISHPIDKLKICAQHTLYYIILVFLLYYDICRAAVCYPIMYMCWYKLSQSSLCRPGSNTRPPTQSFRCCRDTTNPPSHPPARLPIQTALSSLNHINIHTSPCQTSPNVLSIPWTLAGIYITSIAGTL